MKRRMIGAILAIVVHGASMIPVLSATAWADNGLQDHITRVWTCDANGSDASSFNPGEGIQYVFAISSNESFNAQVIVEATGPDGDIYYSANDPSNPVHIPGGDSSFSYSSTIPANAPCGSYTLTITVLSLYPWASTSTRGISDFSVVGC